MFSSAEFEHLQARVGSGGGKGAPVDSGIRSAALSPLHFLFPDEMQAFPDFAG